MQAFYAKFSKSVLMLCAIWQHLYNLKNVKNTHGGVLLLVKFQPATLLKVTLLHGCFSWVIPNLATHYCGITFHRFPTKMESVVFLRFSSDLLVRTTREHSFCLLTEILQEIISPASHIGSSKNCYFAWFLTFTDLLHNFIVAQR